MAQFKLKVGDKVYIDCFTSMGTGGISEVTKIVKKYDSDTGKPYDVIYFGDHQFDSRNGDAISSPTMYYISHKVK
jgi:hypothetical protein